MLLHCSDTIIDRLEKSLEVLNIGGNTRICVRRTGKNGYTIYTFDSDMSENYQIHMNLNKNYIRVDGLSSFGAVLSTKDQQITYFYPDHNSTDYLICNNMEENIKEKTINIAYQTSLMHKNSFISRSLRETIESKNNLSKSSQEYDNIINRLGIAPILIPHGDGSTNHLYFGMRKQQQFLVVLSINSYGELIQKKIFILTNNTKDLDWVKSSNYWHIIRSNNKKDRNWNIKESSLIVLNGENNVICKEE